MNYQTAWEKMRALFSGMMWSLEVKGMHFQDGTETLQWEVGYGDGKAWHIVTEPTAELAIEKLVKIRVEGKATSNPDTVGEVAIPEAPTESSAMPAAAALDGGPWF